MSYNYYDIFVDVNERTIDNKLNTIQQKIDQISREIASLNNSQPNLNMYTQKYIETMNILNNELNIIKNGFSRWNAYVLQNSNFLKKYNINYDDVTLSKLDEIIKKEQNKVMKSNTFIKEPESIYE
jgi:hypothetical protein